MRLETRWLIARSGAGHLALFESHILPYDNNPTGVGEIGLPTAAPEKGTGFIYHRTDKKDPIPFFPVLFYTYGINSGSMHA